MASKPWDMLNPNIGRVSKEVLEERLAICQSCEHFIKLTKQCKKCGCFMRLKGALPHSECPVGKWGTAPAKEADKSK
jgi:hypothetical protein